MKRGFRRVVGLILCGLFSVMAVGCQPAEQLEAKAGRPVRIVTTTGMITDLVRNLVGPDAEVLGLIQEGVDPHLYRPTAADIGRLMQADIVIYNGLFLEGQMQKAFEQFSKTGRTAYAVGSGIPQEKLRFPDGFEAHPDPHIWGDAGMWAECIPQVANVLAKQFPERSAAIHQNAKDYQAQVLAVDAEVRDLISSIPQDSRVLVTAHDAFGYFSQAYNIPVRSVQGITTESDPGVADIVDLVDFLVDSKVPAIFIEATVNQANIQAVMEGARNRGWEVVIGGTLFSDSMGPAGTPEGTYLGMIKFNARTIARALGAPDQL